MTTVGTPHQTREQGDLRGGVRDHEFHIRAQALRHETHAFPVPGMLESPVQHVVGGGVHGVLGDIRGQLDPLAGPRLRALQGTEPRHGHREFPGDLGGPVAVAQTLVVDVVPNHALTSSR